MSKLVYEPKRNRTIILSKCVSIIILVCISILLAFSFAIIMGFDEIFTSVITILPLIGLIEIGLGSFFMLGISESTYAYRAGLNPVYGETILKDRISYRTRQLLDGLNLIITGVILIIPAFFIV